MLAGIPKAFALTLLASVIAAPAMAQSAAPAAPAQASAPAADPGKKSVFAVVGGDFKHFFSADTAHVLAISSVAAVAAVPWEQQFVDQWADNLPDGLFDSGSVVGSFAFQVGVGAATWGVGKAAGHPKAADVGGDLIRAQLVSQAFVQALKYTVQRERPDGSDNVSFPSGHSASAFALGAVLHRHFGWKGAVPGYAFGTYVAMSRLAADKHYLSDVIMGAGFGLAAGRTVTIDMAGKTFGVGVAPTPGGAELTFTKRNRS